MKISLEKFVNSTNCSIAMLDDDLNYLAMSERFLKDLNLNLYNIGDNFKENILYNSENFINIRKKILLGEIVTEEKYIFLNDYSSGIYFYCTWLQWNNTNKGIGGFLLTLKSKEENNNNYIELAQTKAAAKQQLEELENIYVNAPIGLCFIDNLLNFIRMNKRFADLFKLSSKNIIGKNISDTLPPELLDFKMMCNKVLASNSIEIRKDISYITNTDPNNKHYFNEIWYPTKDINGHISGIGLVIQEITNLKHIKALETADIRKNAFLITLSHELRNPLSVIRNALYLLSKHDSSDENIRKQNQLAINIASERADQMIKIINELLDISRINEGKIELKYSHFDLRDILQNIYNESTLSPNLKCLKIEINITKEPLIIRGDHLRVTQIISNIFDNACKFTQPDGTIKLEAYREKSHAVILIEDNGIGIETHNLQNIFDTFSQITVKDRASQSGIGIGLSLCRNLVNLHKGQIEVHSSGLGQGSKFCVKLPLD